MNESLSLLELAQRLQRLVHVPDTQNVWVTAELSDVAVRGGHCFMELLQKDDRGQQQAKMRAAIWANVFRSLSASFYNATGQTFSSGIKVRLLVSASLHPVFGLSLVVSNIDPAYTMGDLLRRRMESLKRLQTEGILELNRTLSWPEVPQRIAVISAPGAAGYGDFFNQLYRNPYRLRFETKLFPATMQGASAPQSIIAALDKIDSEKDLWDGVVIIRGGGSTSDLQAFEDYNLAAHVAQFCLPIAIGIGHERDVTLLDYVANMRLKTPTAVAEWLISLGANLLGKLSNIGNRILQLATGRISGYKEQLAHASATLPLAATGAVQRSRQRLHSAGTALSNISTRRITPLLARLDMISERLLPTAQQRLQAASRRLDNIQQMLEVLSPEATLRRGYTITRVNGHAVASIENLRQGDVIETVLPDGRATSTVTAVESKK